MAIQSSTCTRPYLEFVVQKRQFPGTDWMQTEPTVIAKAFYEFNDSRGLTKALQFSNTARGETPTIYEHWVSATWPAARRRIVKEAGTTPHRSTPVRLLAELVQ